MRTQNQEESFIGFLFFSIFFSLCDRLQGSQGMLHSPGMAAGPAPALYSESIPATRYSSVLRQL